MSDSSRSSVPFTQKVHAFTIRYTIPIVAVVYLISLAILPQDSFWIADNDNKFLQVEAISESGFSDYSIPWPGRSVDPGFLFNPLPAPFSQVSDGQLYSIFSPVFAALSVIPYRLFGFWGLYLLPFSGGILTLLGLRRLGRNAGLTDGIVAGTVLVAGLSTPLWFYSVLFWEHTVAVACCVWAVVFLTAYADEPSFRRLMLMSLTAAAGVYFRDELYLFCAVMVVTVALLAPDKNHRRQIILQSSLIMAGALVPLWLFQWRAIGQPFGFHLGMHIFSANGIATYVMARPRVIYNLLLAVHPNAVVSALVTAPWIVLLLVPVRYVTGHIRMIAGCATVGGLMLSVLVIAGRISSLGPIVWLLGTNSLLAAAPVMVLASIPAQARKKSTLGVVRTVITAYLAAYVLAAPEMGSTGIHWGNRFLLVLYPLMVLSAVSAIAGIIGAGRKWRKAAIVAVSLLIVVSITLQVYSIGLIGTKKDFNHRLTAAIALRPERVLVTDVWWAPQALSRVFYERQIFYAPDQEALQDLGRRLVGTGTTAVLYITAGGERAVQRGAIRIDDGGLEFFTLDLVPLTLQMDNSAGTR